MIVSNLEMAFGPIRVPTNASTLPLENQKLEQLVIPEERTSDGTVSKDRRQKLNIVMHGHQNV
jgi:hypothetical protein